MITGDLDLEIAAALRDAVASGEMPASATGLAASGTWRPAPTAISAGAGTYATSLPLVLASRLGIEPGPLAGLLARRLEALPWVTAAQSTGPGYLTITVGVDRLAGLAERIAAAGSGRAANCGALAGVRVCVPAPPALDTARSWQDAWRDQRDAVSGRLARAAGAEVLTQDSQQIQRASSATRAGAGRVAAAVAYYGADAVRYALARATTGEARAIERQLAVPLDVDNPFVAVRYAHAEASAMLRRAGELRLAVAGPGARAAAASAGRAGSRPRWQPQLPELAVLDALSWLPERVAAAARRRRPAELTSCLEHIADAWLDCARLCPVLPFGGRSAPVDPGGPLSAARCGLADAVAVALAAGCALLAIGAPERI